MMGHKAPQAKTEAQNTPASDQPSRKNAPTAAVLQQPVKAK
jgi:hypothetical protein